MKKRYLLTLILFININNFYAQITVDVNNNVGIGITTPDNIDNFSKSLDIFGNNSSKSLIRTSTITSGLWSHNAGYAGSSAGGFVGTVTNHPFSIITNKITRLTVNNYGNIGIGGFDPNTVYAWGLKKGDFQVMYGTNGFGGYARFFNNCGGFFYIGSYHYPLNYLKTRIGINYSINGTDGESEYAILGSKKAPIIEFNAEEGCVAIYGENGNSTGNYRSTNLHMGIYVAADGTVGIGRKPTQGQLDVAGSIYLDGTAKIASDARLKNNINNIQNGLKELVKLKGVTYYRNKPNRKSSSLQVADMRKTLKPDSVILNSEQDIEIDDYYNRKHIGFLAQDLQKIYPELVYQDEDGMLSIDYIGLIPVLVESVKEINSQVLKIEELTKKLATTDAKLIEIENMIKNKRK